MKDLKEWHKRKIIKRALSVALPDGIYIVYRFNQSHKNEKDGIDMYHLFQSESPETIQEWIKRCEKLLSSNWDVGDALVSMAHAHSRANKKRGIIQTIFLSGIYMIEYKQAKKKYEQIKKEFIKNNPGFSEETYESAIQNGASYACH